MDTYKFVPTVGEFRVQDRVIEFLGKFVEAEPSAGASTSPTRLPAIGTILFDQYFTSGNVSGSVVFSDVGARAACEIMVGYDVERRGFIAAGVTDSDFYAFGIREWQPGPPGSQVAAESRWVPLALGGDRSFIKAGNKYDIKVSVTGSRIGLEVNGVQIVTANMRAPILAPRQVGIWCLSHAKVTVCDFVVSAVRPRAFVVMHFAKPFDDVYAEVIKDTCREFGLDTVRADELYGPGLILNDIVDQIWRSQVVIAEITPENANVYFEIGYALACNKPIILLAREGTKLPFDVSGLRVLFYEDSIGGKTRLQKGLQQHLHAIMGRV